MEKELAILDRDRADRQLIFVTSDLIERDATVAQIQPHADAQACLVGVAKHASDRASVCAQSAFSPLVKNRDLAVADERRGAPGVRDLLHRFDAREQRLPMDLLLRPTVLIAGLRLDRALFHCFERAPAAERPPRIDTPCLDDDVSVHETGPRRRATVALHLVRRRDAVHGEEIA